MAEIVVSGRRRYPQPPDVLWRVFADPEISSTLDERVSLISSSGAPGTVGSFYDLALKMGPVSMTQRVTVRAATENQRLEAVTEVEGKVVAVQLAELLGTDGGTDVTWTVTMTAARPLAGVVRRKASQELGPWLAAADAAAQRIG